MVIEEITQLKTIKKNLLERAEALSCGNISPIEAELIRMLLECHNAAEENIQLINESVKASKQAPMKTFRS